MKTLAQLWHDAVFARDNNLCQKCWSEGEIVFATDAHHIIHKTGGKYLRYLRGNGVALCRSCHDLDSQGKLLQWCIEWIGEDKYYEMKRKGNEVVASNSFDEDLARARLRDPEI